MVVGYPVVFPLVISDDFPAFSEISNRPSNILDPIVDNQALQEEALDPQEDTLRLHTDVVQLPDHSLLINGQ